MKYLSKEPIYSKAPTPESEATWERVFGKMKITTDESVPVGEVHFERAGMTVGKIINVGK